MKKRLLLLLFLLLPVWCGGATYYVSQSATNGYQIGADTNAGTSKDAPFLTVGKAVATATTAGDSIVLNDGDYLSTDGANGATCITIIKPISVTGETYRGATITTTSTDYSIYINPSASGIYTIGQININSDNKGLSGIRFVDTAHSNTLVIAGTTVINPTTYGVRMSEPNMDLSISDMAIQANNILAGGAGVYHTTLAAGDINIDGLELDMTINAASYAMGVQLKSTTGTGSDLNIAGVTGSIEATDGSGQVYGIAVSGFPTGTIEDSDLTVISTSTINDTYGIYYYTSGTIYADNGVIRNNRIIMDAITGTAILSGISGATNYVNGTWIHHNEVYCTNTDPTKTPHGIAFSYGTGGIIEKNYIVGFNPPVILSRADNTSVVSYNIAYGSYGMYGLYAKASTGGAFYNNTTYTNGTGLSVAGSDGASTSPSTGII